MKTYTLSIICIIASTLPYSILYYLRNDEGKDHEWIAILLGLFCFAFTIFTYRTLLRIYGSERRKVLETDLGMKDCQVLPLFNEIKKQQLRVKHGLTPTIQHAQPPSLPTHSERDATSSHDTLSEKLKTLQKMKLDGLITEQEYDEKKAEILKRF